MSAELTKGDFMKKFMVVFLAVGMFGAMPVLAADHSNMSMDTKDGVRQCALEAESIQAKIKRLETEVAKGNSKYSADDLKKLKLKLKEANDILEQIGKN
jgi:hypothetical protein